MNIPVARRRALAPIILFLLCGYQLDAYAGDQKDVSRESDEQAMETIRVEAEAARKSRVASDAAFKTWMYDADSLSFVDELTGKKHLSTTYDATLFARKPSPDSHQLVLFISATLSDVAHLREKTDVWFQDSKGGILSEGSGKSYCSTTVCPMRIRFDDRAPILLNVKSRSDGKYFTVRDPLRFIAELKKSREARLEVPYVDENETLTTRIYTLDVFGLKWNISK